MVKKDIKPAVPLKLQRYLATIARRKNIKQIRIAAVVTDGSSIVLSAHNTLPFREVDEKGLGAAIEALAQELGSDVSVTRYIGYYDIDGRIRQYSFRMNSTCIKDGFKRLDLHKALGLLRTEEAKVVASVLDCRGKIQTKGCRADPYQ